MSYWNPCTIKSYRAHRILKGLINTSKPTSDQKLRKSLSQRKDFPGIHPKMYVCLGEVEEGYTTYHAEENNLDSYSYDNNLRVSQP